MLEPAVDVPARRPTVSVPARLAVVLDAAVDAPARPDGAAVPPDAAAYGVYPLIILIVYVLVTGGILCSRQSDVYLTTFGPVAKIRWRVWGTLYIFQRVSHLGSVTARHSSTGHQPNFAALNRGRHLYSARGPSRWALAHILVFSF